MGILSAALLAGCAASGDDTTSSSGSDMGANVSDMGQGCAIVTVSSIDAVSGAVKKTAPARLLASVTAFGASGPHWTLTHTGDATSVVPMMSEPSNLRVQYDADAAGTWTFQVTFDSGPCRGTNSLQLAGSGVTDYYRFRALPPETSGFPLTETVVGVQSAAQTVNLTLDPGLAVNGVLRAGGVATAGEVRLIADTGPDADAITDANGKFALAVRANQSYTPLLIPQAVTLAPHLGSSALGSSFLGAAFDVSSGAAVTGTIVDPAATAIVEAHAVLRAGPLPSGQGTTDAGG
ncbi:MAG: hypothetical protein JWM53_374, partial [bacterium]|nr:hypothetical protein [bacterium]